MKGQKGLITCENNERPIRRNPKIARMLYYSKDIESFGTGLKRIAEAFSVNELRQSNCVDSCRVENGTMCNPGERLNAALWWGRLLYIRNRECTQFRFFACEILC